MVANEHAVDLLNGLIETTLDSAHGYKEAAEHVSSPQLKRSFAERADQRLDLSRQLQQEVRRLGGEPKNEQSLLGKAHNKFAALKGAMTGDNVKSVVDEVERGEDAIKGRYEKAASETDLPMETRQFVQTAYASIKADHDDVSRVKHELH
ncbi:MAG: PA2169 family four-helix-bundle protein [Caulobacteraceae bacterium]|nr:PA2169 family four-helix-bundle protein [Caulobacteraceae bacterium]